MVTVQRDCLGDLHPPTLPTIVRVECEGDDAVACFDWTNAVKLTRLLEELRGYIAEAEIRCRKTEEE